MELFGYKEDAEGLKKMFGPGLTSKRTHHMSRKERKDTRKVDKISKHESRGQLVIHPIDGGSPRSFEKLPSVDMLLNRR